MPPNTYDVGSAITIKGEFYDTEQLQFSDPTTVVCKYRKPDGTIVTVPGGQVQHTDIGKFKFTISPDMPGEWRFHMAGSGGIIAAEERMVRVQETYFD